MAEFAFGNGNKKFEERLQIIGRSINEDKRLMDSGDGTES